MDAQQLVVDLLFGRWRSQILYAGTTLGIFDLVSTTSLAADEIANKLKLDPKLTYRLLRALGAIGLLSEDAARCFSVTDAGAYLARDHPQSLRAMTLLEEGPELYRIWQHLPDMVRDGRQNAFVREYGHMAFDHTASDPDYDARFNDAMSSYSNIQSALVVEALSGSDIPKSSRLCDIAGGFGHLMGNLLTAYPGCTGMVFDLPGVVSQKNLLLAAGFGVAERCAYVGGDMFEAVPADDVYFLKLILHDWNDDECVQILETIRRNAETPARVFIVEHLITEPDTPHFSKLFDIHMMCWGTGRERSPAEYASLLERAGWQHSGTRYPASHLMGLVEGVTL